MTRNSATLIGFLAILLWSLLALFTVGTAPMPPLQLNAVCFTLATAVGLIWTLSTGGLSELTRVSWKVYAFGTAGLFGYHLLYFTALRLAPAAEAGLIAYLWPLLIVLFSGLLPGEQLRKGHVLGAIISFSGAALIIARGGGGFSPEALPGYAAAGLCALTWSGYSVLSRRLGAVPTNSVTVFCAFTAILSALAHLAFETTVWPAGALGWISVDRAGVRARRAGLLCLGYRRQTRRHSDAGRGLVCSTFAIDAGAGRLWRGTGVGGFDRGGGADCRWRLAGRARLGAKIEGPPRLRATPRSFQ